MEQTPVYDIRTSENAMKTLVALTGVSPDVWKRYFSRESEYAYPEDLIEDVIQKHGKFPVNYTDWTFIYFHVTTSADQCASFYKHGILDLVHSYQCTDSELRKFLDAHDIEIYIDNQTLCYKKRIYDISYGKCPFDSQSEAFARWIIGHKFYYDFTTCGFLSAYTNSPYGGNVHFRPEILVDIDELLGTKLSDEWRISHKPYEVVAAIKGMDINYVHNKDDSEKDKNLYYLTKAYYNAFESLSEEIILLKNGVQIPPDRIMDIRPLHCWKGNQSIFQNHPLRSSAF